MSSSRITEWPEPDLWHLSLHDIPEAGVDVQDDPEVEPLHQFLAILLIPTVICSSGTAGLGPGLVNADCRLEIFSF